MHVVEDVVLVQPEIRGLVGGVAVVNGHGQVCIRVEDLLHVVLVRDRELEELWQVEDHPKDDGRAHVGPHPAPRVVPAGIDHDVVLHRLVHGPEPLGGQDHGRVDGAGEADVLQLVQEVDEDDLLGLGGVVVLPDRLQDAAADEHVVEHGEEDQEPVEDGGHLLGAQDGDGDAVADEAGDAHRDHDHALYPPGELGVHLEVVVHGIATVGGIGHVGGVVRIHHGVL